MGYAIAEAARDRGARVTLISGPVALARPPDVETVEVVSAEDLSRAVDQHLDGVRVVVMAAAVADQKPKTRARQKVKKQPGEESLTLVPTPDILATLGARAQRPLLVGFAAETENVEANAREKLQRKNLDLIVANDVAQAFGKETNQVLVLGKDGARREVQGSKLAVAHAILDMVRERLPS
jgi:phosphopantothenoylcysteine decarboxylase/phosphopantothenate--cysteine ligase